MPTNNKPEKVEGTKKQKNKCERCGMTELEFVKKGILCDLKINNGEHTFQDIAPMGVSQWREHGKKYKYWDYFTKEVLEERNKEAKDQLIKEAVERIEKKEKEYEVNLKYEGFNQALEEAINILNNLKKIK